ncbi:MAG: hypothetical protein LBB79_09395, partial [Prevotellaceae bacterium]|nr:hypothetical protein [Prevotellaceae bacterium]
SVIPSGARTGARRSQSPTLAPNPSSLLFPLTVLCCWRFLRCARSCLAHSGRNDGWGRGRAGARCAAGAVRNAPQPVRQIFHKRRSTTCGATNNEYRAA